MYFFDDFFMYEIEDLLTFLTINPVVFDKLDNLG